MDFPEFCELSSKLTKPKERAMDMKWSKLREIVKDREAWHAAVPGVTETWTQLSNQTRKDKVL